MPGLRPFVATFFFAAREAFFFAAFTGTAFTLPLALALATGFALAFAASFAAADFLSTLPLPKTVSQPLEYVFVLPMRITDITASFVRVRGCG